MIEILFSLAGAFADLAFIKFGAVLIRVVSLGHWHAESVVSQEHRYRSNAGALSYRVGTTRVVTCTGQKVVAAVFWASLGFAAYAIVF